MTEAAYICPHCRRVLVLPADQQPQLGKPKACPAHDPGYPIHLVRLQLPEGYEIRRTM